jgi:hypothetical protein
MGHEGRCFTKQSVTRDLQSNLEEDGLRQWRGIVRTNWNKMYEKRITVTQVMKRCIQKAKS